MPASAAPNVYCAYDGSVNAHWLARYAIHLAAATPQRRLGILHVADGHLCGELLRRKLALVRGDAERAGVHAAFEEAAPAGTVAARLLQLLPPGADSLIVCGTRARARRSTRLRGTVSEALLRTAPGAVLALRVVLPGLLGAPRAVLLPVAGNPGEGRALAPLLALLASGVERLYLLRVALMQSRRGSPARAAATRERLRAHARAALTHVENELRASNAISGEEVDALVRLGEDWVTPAMLAASQHHCGLILASVSAALVAGEAGHVREVERLLTAAPCDVALYRPAR